MASASAALRASLERLATTRLVSAWYCGSRSVRSTTMGVARNSEEYAPEARPTNRISARSLIVPTPSSPAPTNSSPATGSSAISEVLIERISVWFTARFAASEYVVRDPARMSFEFSATLS